MMRLTMLHTAQVHCATFDALRDRIAPGVDLVHVVRPDWLERAQTGVTPELSKEITEAIMAVTDKTICTCTTLGPIAANAGAIRIDQPMMRAAAKAGGPVLMVYCLDSTLKPSMDLLKTAMKAAQNPSEIQTLSLHEHWPLFETGDHAGFAKAIAGDIRRAILPAKATIVLAQASMAGAAEILPDFAVPVLASPELALKTALAGI